MAETKNWTPFDFAKEEMYNIKKKNNNIIVFIKTTIMTKTLFCHWYNVHIRHRSLIKIKLQGEIIWVGSISLCQILR